ncbi:MAG: hypothetical protein Q9160_009271 [Pyrenula sp. 1 TL-2023]
MEHITTKSIDLLSQAEILPTSNRITFTPAVRERFQNSLLPDLSTRIIGYLQALLSTGSSQRPDLNDGDRNLHQRYRHRRFCGGASTADECQSNPIPSLHIHHDPLHYLDQPLFDIKVSLCEFANNDTSYFRLNYADWAPHVCKALDGLTFVIRTAISSLEFREWDGDVLRDAVDSLRYYIFDFYGPVALILQHCSQCEQTVWKRDWPVENGKSSDKPNDIGEDCVQSLLKAEFFFMTFILHLSIGQVTQDGKDSREKAVLVRHIFEDWSKELVTSPVPDTVPAVGFLELVVRNQMWKNRAALSAELNQNETDAAARFIGLSPLALSFTLPLFPRFPLLVLLIFLTYFWVFADTNSRSESLLRPWKEAVRTLGQNDLIGMPRCIAIVMDPETGYVTTGATQPTHSDEFIWLKNVEKKIHSLRIMPPFRRAVHACTKDVVRLIEQKESRLKQSLSDDEVHEIYDELMRAPKTTDDLLLPRSPLKEIEQRGWLSRMTRDNAYEAMPKSKRVIFSFALDTKNFEWKAPCLRCHRMFSGWGLQKTPQSSEDKRASSKGRYMIKWKKKDGSTTYCGETVAAARFKYLETLRLLY